MPLPRWVEPQLSKLVERAPTGPNWDQCARLPSKAERERRANTDRSGRKLRTRKIDPELLLPTKPLRTVNAVKRLKALRAQCARCRPSLRFPFVDVAGANDPPIVLARRYAGSSSSRNGGFGGLRNRSE